MANLDLAVVIPARGGSKRIPRKNIRPLLGKPLLLYTIEAARRANVTQDILVSTDDDEIAAIAADAQARVVQRPTELASDSASTESVILHCLDVLAGEGRNPEWVMTLPPTSPLRRPDTIEQIVSRAFETTDAPDCFFTVHECREDFWRGEPTEKIERLFPNAPRRQQDREPLWVENSAVYLTRAQALRETRFILGRSVLGFPISVEEATDINTEMDFFMAESLLKNPQI